MSFATGADRRLKILNEIAGTYIKTVALPIHRHKRTSEGDNLPRLLNYHAFGQNHLILTPPPGARHVRGTAYGPPARALFCQ